MIKLRVTFINDKTGNSELEHIIKILNNECNILNVSNIYTGRVNTKYCNQYIDLELKEGLDNE